MVADWCAVQGSGSKKVCCRWCDRLFFFHALHLIFAKRCAADGAGITADGAGITADGAGITADGAGITADGAGITADGAGITAAS